MISHRIHSAGEVVPKASRQKARNHGGARRMIIFVQGGKQLHSVG